jgi:hypothetical protein
MAHYSFLIAVFVVCGCGAGDAASPRSSAPTPATNRGAAMAGVPAGPSGVAGNGFGNSTAAPVQSVAPKHAAANCNKDVDILFVLDVSGSMGPPLTTLKRESSLVDDALNAKALPSPQHYGLVIFVDDVQVMNGGMPYAGVDALQAELANQIDMTNANASRQVDGTPSNLTWPENSLDALYAGATQFQWRPAESTLRTIILITDASFWDLTEPSSGSDVEANPGLFPEQASMHGYDETVAALRSQMIWVNTFTAKTGGPPDGMTSPPSHGNFRGTSVDVGIGFFEPYKGKPSIPDATGGFAWDIDDVFDGKISLATPINQSIEVHQCATYPVE